MLFLEPEQRTEYLEDLHNQLKEVGCSELADAIKIIKDQQEGRQESKFPIEKSGFPSAPTFVKDIESALSKIKKDEEENERLFEQIRRGDATKLKFKQPPNISPGLKRFVDFDKVGDDFRRYYLQEKDGWLEWIVGHASFEISEKTIADVCIRNSDEFAGLGATIVGSFFFPPLIITYPIVLFAKYSRNKNRRLNRRDQYYLVTDISRWCKTKGKESFDRIKPTKRETQAKLKYIHPLNKEGFEEPFHAPVLICKGHGGLQIESGDKKLEEMLNAATAIDKSFLYFFRDTTFEPSRDLKPTYSHLPSEAKDQKNKIGNFLELLDKKEEIDISEELYKLSDDEIKGLLEILKKYANADIEAPKGVYVDCNGTLYPPMLLWFYPALAKSYTDYLTGKETLTFSAFFTENAQKGFKQPTESMLDFLTEIPMGYVYVNREQLSLKEPENLYKKLKWSPPIRKWPSTGKKDRIRQLLKQFSKSDSLNRSIECSIFSLRTYCEPINLQEEIDRMITQFQNRYKDLSEEEQKKYFDGITKLQSDFRKRFGLATSEKIMELKRELAEINRGVEYS